MSSEPSRRFRLLSFALLVSILSSLLPAAAAQATAPAAVVSPFVASVPAAPPVESAAVVQPDVQPTSRAAHAQQPPVAAPAFGQLPLSFIPNQGQTDGAVQFQVNGAGGTVFFTPDEVVLALPAPEPAAAPASRTDSSALRSAGADPATRRAPPAVARIQFDGMNPQPTVEGINPLPGVVNYFIGNDPAQWHTDIPTYGGIVYKDIYPGIDLRYAGVDGQIKATYHVAAGADPSQIRWRYDGASGVTIDPAGNLQVSIPQPSAPVSATATVTPTAVVGTPRAYLPLVGSAQAQRTLTEQTPVSWQEANGTRTAVTSGYQLAADGSVQFALGSYDPAQPLVLDPLLIYDVPLGGSGTDQGNGIAVDSQGNAYIVGETNSTNFPTTNPLQGYGGGTTCGIAGSPTACPDVFVTKLNAAGTQRLYSTYLGGNTWDRGSAIAVDGAGNAYITGETNGNFPMQSPYQSTNAGVQNAFVTKLAATGNALVYSTYLGGGNGGTSGSGIAVDAAGNAYVTGTTASSGSTPFPTQNAYQTTKANDADAFVTKFNASGSGLVYSTYLGGEGRDAGIAIALDTQGAAYITGNTNDATFPTQGALQAFGGGTCTPPYACGDAFIAKLSAGGSSLSYSTFLGGTNEDGGIGIAVDAQGAAYVVGHTQSANFPVQNALQSSYGGYDDAFVAKLNSSGSAYVFKTYLGGSSSDNARAVAVTNTGAVVTGLTASANFPIKDSPFFASNEPAKAFLTAFNTTGAALEYSGTTSGTGDSTAGYGVAVDTIGSAYVTGKRSGDAFVVKVMPSTLDPASTRGNEGCQCNPVQPQPERGGPINTRTGNYATQTTDLRVETPGLPLVWSRIYASQAITDTTGELGPGWQHPYGARLILPTTVGGDVIVYSGANNRLRFTEQPDGTFQAVPGVYSTLTRSGGSYLQTERDQTIRTFSATTGQLTGVRDPQNRQITLSYTSGRLTQIKDAFNTSRKLTLTYDTSNRIQTVSDGTRQVIYGYTTASDLGTVQDVMLRVTTYQYQSHLLTKIIDPLNQIVEQQQYDVYTPQGKVIQQTLQNGQTLVFAYQADATIVTTTGLDGRQDVERIGYGANNATTGSTINGEAVLGAGFDNGFSPEKIVDGNGNTTQTAYTSQGLPTQQTNALGQTSRMEYDARNNLLAMTDAQGVTTRWRYDARNNVISSTVGLTSTGNVALTTLTRYDYQSGSGLWGATANIAVDSRVYEQEAPDGVITRYLYDTTYPHLVTEQIVGPGTAAQQRTTYSYDSLKRLQTTTSGAGTPLARSDRTDYNDDNTVQRTIQNYKDGTFDATKPDEDIVTTYGYDGAGRQIWMRDVYGRYDVTHYNAKGRVDWSAQNFTASGWNGGTTLPALPAYSPTKPDQNVAMQYGYDGLGRTTLVTQTGILTGTFNPTTLQWSATTQRVTRTEFDKLSRPVTTTLNYRPGLPSTADTNVQTITQYDGAGNVIHQRDALGRWTYTDYDALNRPITTTVNFQDGKPLTGSRDADIQTVTRYDAVGRVDRTWDNYVDGTFTATEPITDRVTLYEYDLLGRTTATIQNADPTQTTRSDTNRRTQTDYQVGTGRMLGTRDPLGRWTSQQYDLLGRVNATIQNCRNGSGTPVSSGCGTQTVERNVRTQTGYDALGRTTLMTDALGIVTRTVYDGLGRTTQTIQNYVAGGPTTAITNVTMLQQYDGLGRAIASTDATNVTSRSGYNRLGQTTVITDAAGRVTQQGYDGSGSMRWTKRPDGQITVMQIDGLGRAVATIQNYQDGVVAANEPRDRDLITRTIYDAGGRRVRAIDAASRVTQFAYDNLDRLTGVTENVLQSGCTTARTDCNVTTTYQYDRVGNRTAIVDARGNTRRFAYNAADELIEERDGLNRLTSHTYDKIGNMRTTTDPRGAAWSMTYDYDELNRPKNLTAGSNANLPPISMAYDARGQRTRMSDGSGTTSFGYDKLGRVTSVQAPNTGTVGYRYTARGERDRITYPGTGAPVIDYTYLPDGRLDLVKQGTTTLADYGYDPLGRMQTVARANGVTTSYDYDNADRLKTVATMKGSAVLSRFGYLVNRLGLRTDVTETMPFTTTTPSPTPVTPSPTTTTPVPTTPVPTTTTPTPPSGTRLKTITFEDGSLTHPTSGADSTVGSVLLETAAPLAGSASATMNNTTSTYLVEAFADTDTVYGSFLLRVNAIPSSTTIIAQFRDSSTSYGNLQLTSSGKLRLRNGSNTVGSDSATLTVGTTYRIGLRQTRQSGSTANGTLEAFVVAGDTAFGSPFAQSSTQSLSVAVNRAWVGSINSSGAVRITVDNLALDTAAFAPPATTTPTPVPTTPVPTTTTPTPTPPSATTVRLNAGGPAVTTGGVTWSADQFFDSGVAYTSTAAIANTTDDALYQTERYASADLGPLNYAIPVTNGSYTVRLHFAELYFTASGKRVFSANLEGGAVELQNYDIYAAVGTNAAVIKEYTVAVSDGMLNIAFTSSVNRAKVNAIEIIPASGSTPTPVTPTTTTPAPTTTTPTPVTPTPVTPTPTPGSTRLRTVTLENSSLTDATTGFSTTSGTVARDTTSPLKGIASFGVPNSSTGYGTISVADQDEVWVTSYVRFTSIPGSARIVRIVTTGSVTDGNLSMSSGKITLRNGSTTIGTGVTLAANTTYRVGIHQKRGTTSSNGVLEAYVATGDAAFGAPFASSSSQSVTSPVTRVEIGATNSVTLNAVFDDIAVDTGSLPGPSASVAGPALARVDATTQPIVAQVQAAGSVIQAWGNVPQTTLQQTGVQTRTITYGYDDLNRLTSAVEGGATTNTYSYQYDKAGNRLDGGRTYDAANQVIGWTYDAAGNLLSDGTTTYSYDALNRAVTTGGTANSYNADGTLVQQGTTRYTHDLAAPLSQILGDGTSTYIYGQERLYAQASGGAKLWYATDALGSVRQTLNDSGAVLGNTAYDPWGVPQQGSVPTFGFTGELQQGSNVYLRARWYNANRGTFTSRDPFAGMPQQPYSLMPYQYAYSAPTTWTDASGRAVSDGGDGGYGPCPAGQTRIGTRCTPSGIGGGSGGGWTAPPVQAGGLVTVPPPSGVNPPFYPGGVMPFQPVPAPVPPVAPALPPVTGWWLVGGLGAVCLWALTSLSGDSAHELIIPQPQPRPLTPQPTPEVSTSERCTESSYSYGQLESFDPDNPSRKRATSAKATLCIPLGKGTSFSKGRNGTLIEGRGGAFPDRGHLIAKELGGRGIRENGVPMSPKLNQYPSRLREIELEVKAAVLSKNDIVRYEVTPIYNDTNGQNPIPSSIHILAIGGTIHLEETLMNQP